MTAKYRAWVMVTRQRDNGDFYAAERHLRDLQQMDPSRFKKVMSVYGSYDAIVILETESLFGIHDAIVNMTSRGGILYTTTFVAVDPDFSSRTNIDGPHQACVGICTFPGMQMKTRAELVAQGFDVADVVFGDFDVMALFRPGTSFHRSLIDAVQAIPTIRKTTTMLPHQIVPDLLL